jgi:Sel1 repeat
MNLPKLSIFVAATLLIGAMVASTCNAADVVGVIDSADAAYQRKDYDLARKLALPAAQAGDAAAQYRLGVLMRDGHGISRDDKAATKWFTSAAEQNHSPAMTALALMHQSGDGVERDTERAAALLTKAAELGNAEAQFKLGQAYQAGLGVTKNLIRARYWYESADALQAEAARPKDKTTQRWLSEFTKALPDDCKPRRPLRQRKHNFRPIEIKGLVTGSIDAEGRVRGIRAQNVSDDEHKYEAVALFSDSLRAPECAFPAEARDVRFAIPFRITLH